jgi:hypothetical protein
MQCPRRGWCSSRTRSRCFLRTPQQTNTNTNHCGSCMLVPGESEIVCQFIQLLCHIAALRSPEPRCTGSHPDDHEIMAKRPVLLDLTLETPSSTKVLIILTSTVSAPFPGYLLSEGGPELPPASGSSPGWLRRPSSLSRRCDSSTLKSCSFLTLKHWLSSLSVASSQLRIFSLFVFRPRRHPQITLYIRRVACACI